LEGSGRRANSGGMVGFGNDGVTGVAAVDELAGVPVLDGRGLFFERGRDGAWRKSSGMSFQLSMAGGARVVIEGTREGAEADFGGGGGRFGVGDAFGGGLEGCSCRFATAGFFSQPDSEGCSMLRMCDVDGVDGVMVLKDC
jgi:hypothetical protein